MRNARSRVGIRELGRSFRFIHRRRGEIIAEWWAPNMVTMAGLNYLLNAGLAAGTQITTWYVLLVNNTDFSQFSIDDTASSHAGWTELTSYTEATRPVWTAGGVASGTVNNPSGALFTVNATVVIRGAALISVNTKGGTTGTLYAAGDLDRLYRLKNLDTLTVFYENQAVQA